MIEENENIRKCNDEGVQLIFNSLAEIKYVLYSNMIY